MEDSLSAAARAETIFSIGIRTCQELIEFYQPNEYGLRRAAKTVLYLQHLLVFLVKLQSILADGEADPEDLSSTLEDNLTEFELVMEKLQQELAKIRRCDPISLHRDLISPVNGGLPIQPFRGSSILRTREIVWDLLEHVALLMDSLGLQVRPQFSNRLNRVRGSSLELEERTGEDNEWNEGRVTLLTMSLLILWHLPSLLNLSPFTGNSLLPSVCSKRRHC